MRVQNKKMCITELLQKNVDVKIHIKQEIKYIIHSNYIIFVFYLLVS